MGFFLNPLLVERAAAHLRSERETGRKRLPNLGSLVLLLNACHAASRAGLVVVSQAYLGERCGGISARSVRTLEAELVAAGLLERRLEPGLRRVLVLLEPGASSPQVVHNSGTAPVRVGDPGAVVPGTPARWFRGPAKSPTPPNKDRARVSQGEELRKGSEPPSPDEAVARASRSLAVSVSPDRSQSIALGVAVAQLVGTLGRVEAASALGAVERWVSREARSDAASLAVAAVSARARHGLPSQVRQRSLFA